VNQLNQDQSNQNQRPDLNPTITPGMGNISILLICLVGVLLLGVVAIIGLGLMGILPLDKLGLGSGKQGSPVPSKSFKSGSDGGLDQQSNSNVFSVSQPAKFAQSVDVAGDLTAPNILYSLIAGKGIYIGPGQTPTVTNTGVLSLNGQTGSIALSGGITTSGSTLTLSDIPNSALSHSKVTINAGGNLSGGGDVSLGDSTTLALKSDISLATATFSGTLGVGGEASISSKLIFNYLGNLGTLVWSPTGSQTVTVPDATGTICLTTGNCSGIGGVVGGSGTQNFVAKWNAGGTTLGNSLIYDNGSNVGIGTTNPASTLDVKGIGTFDTAIQTQGLTDHAPYSTVTTSGGTISNTGPNFRGYNSYWVASATGQYICFNMGQANTMKGVTFASYWRTDASLIPKDYQIDYSSTSCTASLTNFVTVTGNTKASVAHYSAAGFSAQFIKITINGFQGGQTQSNMSGVQILVQDNGALWGYNPWAMQVVGSPNNVFLATGGNVGIGTTSPTNILSLGNTQAQKIWIENTANTVVGRALTVAAGSTVTAGTADMAGGNLILTSGLGKGTGASSISFQTGTTLTTGSTLQTMSEKMVILGNGNVGIGTTAPALRLDVRDSQSATAAAMVFNTDTGANASGLVVKLGFTGTGASTNHFINFLDGNGRIQGSIQSNGANGVTYAQNGIADFAEYMKAASPSALPAGTVVCQSDSGVVACDKDSLSKVIGIRSDHPAFLGGVNSTNAVIVGLVGQVPVRIAPDSSSISSGDFLTVSATYPGMAEKSVQAGYTVAKALEGWSSGSSQTTILASINLGYSTGNSELAVIPVASPSGSFTLPALNTSPAQALDLASVSAQFGQFSDTLKVIGKTQLGDTTIGGKLAVGLITIDDLKADISAMNGLLSFQQGTVQIDRVGNITTTGTITAKKINISEDSTASGSAILDASIGQSSIPAGQPRVEVKTMAVTGKSRIFVTPRTETGDHVLIVKEVKPGESFSVTIKAAINSDISFDWWIVN
jgi:hypothetical protein